MGGSSQTSNLGQQGSVEQSKGTCRPPSVDLPLLFGWSQGDCIMLVIWGCRIEIAGKPIAM